MWDSATGEIRIWDAKTGKLVRKLEGHSAAVMTAAFSPDQRWIVSVGFGKAIHDAGEVRLWDVATGREVESVAQPLIGLTVAALAVDFSPDSQRLVVAGGLGPRPKQIQVLRVSTGEVLLTMEGHHGTVVRNIANASFGRR